MDFYIVCVLYNKYIEEICSWGNFLKLQKQHRQVRILLVDNSAPDYVERNTAYAENFPFVIYHPNHGNLGLSKSYNTALGMTGDGTAWMLIADDDTDFSGDFLNNIYDASRKGQCAILSGVIREQDRVLSPAKRIQLVERKSDYIRQPGIYDNIYCFNSGLCIRTDVLRLVGGYEERLFVDMVDNCLMEQLRMAGQNRIQVVEGDVRQTFSGFHYEDMDAVVRRYHIFRKDFLEFCNICHKSWIYRWLVVRRKINIVLHLVLRGRWDLMKKVSV